MKDPSLRVLYPQQRDALVEFVKNDRNELNNLSKQLEKSISFTDKISTIRKVAKDCQLRAHEMLKILEVIKEPTIEKIGVIGSEAIILLTLHSYLDIMERILSIYNKAISIDPKSVPLGYVATLIDRISIIKDRRQILGTTWLEDDGTLFLVPVKNFNTVNERRSQYGLDILRYPDNSKNSSVGLKVDDYQKKIPRNIYLLNFAFMDKSIIGGRIH